MTLRSLARWVGRSPLHPQWLLGRRQPPAALSGRGGRVLDVGAADGWLRHFLADDCEYVAFDYPVTVKQLYRTKPHVFGDAANLPFADATFDHVACLEVLEHVRDPHAVLLEIARVLRPGGRAHLTMPFMYPVHDAPHDYQRWTESGWINGSQRAGLEVMGLVQSTHPVETAGVIACLALAGPLQDASRVRQVIYLPIAATLVCVINLGAWLLASIWPTWRAMTVGYHVELVRP